MVTVLCLPHEVEDFLKMNRVGIQILGILVTKPGQVCRVLALAGSFFTQKNKSKIKLEDLFCNLTYLLSCITDF